MTTLTQPIKWHGGKHYLARWIISLMPPHIHYVEPYFGGGSVLLHKDPQGVSEVVNDIHRELMAFWCVLRSEQWFDDFVRTMEATPFSEGMFDGAGPTDYSGPDQGIITGAFRFFIRARQSRQGLMKDFATLSRNRTRRGMNEQVSSWLTAIEGLPDVHARLKRVVILCKPARDVILQQDGPNTLFYLDPPYLHETRVATEAYSWEMSEQAHVDLLDTLSGIEGHFLLSGYRSDLYEVMAHKHGWRRIEKQIDNKASSSKTKEIKTECLWVNYNPPAKAILA